MLPAIPPAVSLGITAAKIVLPVLGKLADKRRSSPKTSTMRLNENGRPEYPEHQTMEYKKTRKEIRQERKENKNRIIK